MGKARKGSKSKQSRKRTSSKDTNSDPVEDLGSQIDSSSSNADVSTRAAKMESKFTSGVLNRKLDSRPTVEDIRGILKKSSAHGMIQNRANQISLKKTADVLSRHLRTRKDVKDIQSSGILLPQNSSMEHKYAGVALERLLKQKLHDSQLPAPDLTSHIVEARKLGKELSSRPSMKELQSRGILVDPVRQKLERHLAAEHVEHALKARDLSTKPVSNKAPAIQGVANSLERGLIKNKLEKGLSEKFRLALHGGSANNQTARTASSIASNAKTLEYQLRKQQLEAQLRDVHTKRQSFIAKRHQYATGFGIIFQLCSHNIIDQEAKCYLKDLLLSNDARVLAAIEVYDIDHDIKDMVDTLIRIVHLRN